MRSKAEILASFLPKLGIAAARRGLSDPPTADVFACGLLFADIAGFTPLTERLVATRGAEGAEELARCLNRVFGELTELVHDFGGDTLKFAGDALLGIWRADHAEVAGAVQRTAECALAIQRALHAFPVSDDLQLSLKQSIGAGEVLVAALGGMRNRFELLVTGAPLAQVALANDAAPSGGVVLSREAHDLLAGSVSARAIDGGWLLDGLTGACERAPRRETHVAGDLAGALRALVPGAIRERIDAGLSEWIAEQRRVTILFVRLPDLTESLPIERAQTMMRIVQEGLYRYEGSLNKLNADDKGVAVLAALGLPPFFHADDAARGIRAARDIERELARHGFRSSIGVTTGSVFCGAIGGPDRREYTIMGDAVNLAARLMMAAASGVLCDRATRDHAEMRQRFEPIAPMDIKGKAKPVEVFRPLFGDADTRSKAEGRRTVLIGRESEQSQLEATLDRLLEETDAASAKLLRGVLVRGRSGIGKSALLDDFARSAERRGATVLRGFADALERGVPYFAWRAIALRLFELDPSWDLERRRAHVEATLASRGISPELGPLLATLLPLGEWSSERIENLEARERAERTRATFCSVLAAFAAEQPTLVILEDVHALDSASWGLTRFVLQQVRGVLGVLSARADETSALDELDALEAEAAPEVLPLGELSRAAVLEIIRQRLGVDVIPDAVASAITERAEGNPRFAEELILALRDSGMLVRSARGCRLRPDAQLTSDALPPTLQAALTRRIDQLGAAEQLTLKVASVVGPEFALDPLQEIYPVAIDSAALLAHVRELERRDLTERVVSGADAGATPSSHTETYRFRSRIAQQVAYDLMLFSQRRSLHRRLAEWYEAESLDLAPLYSILARHWRTAAEGPNRTADDVTRALGYLERAAEQAAYSYANHDAIRAYREAIELVGWLPDTRERRSRELTLRLALGPVLVNAVSWGAREVEENYRRALELAAEVGAPDQRFQALRGLWQFESGQGAQAEAEALGEQLISVARESGDTRLLLEAERMLGNNAFWLGDLPRACTHLQAAVALADPALDASQAARYGQDPEVANRGILSWALCLRGESESGLREAKQAVERARALEHPFSLAFALGANMWAHAFLQQPEPALGFAERTLELTQQRSFAYLETAARVVHGWARARLSEPDGVDEIETAIREWREAGSSIGMAVFLTTLADACLASRDPERARRVLEDPVLAGRGASEGWLEPFIRCLWAAAARQRREPDAFEALRAAADFARARGAHLIERRALALCTEGPESNRPPRAHP